MEEDRVSWRQMILRSIQRKQLKEEEEIKLYPDWDIFKCNLKLFLKRSFTIDLMFFGCVKVFLCVFIFKWWQCKLV